MAFNSEMVDRIRELLVDQANVEERQLFGGLCFMVNDKMCMGVVKDEIMCRIDPEEEAAAMELEGSRPMDFTGKRMKGFVFVNEDGLRTREQYAIWVDMCLRYNPLAKASKKKLSKNTKLN